MIYKIAPASFWRATEELGSFSGTQTDLADGFLHFLTEEQVRETAEKYFRGQVGLLLIAVDKDRLGKALRFEPSRGGAFFPHLYAPLPRDPVVFAKPLPLLSYGGHDFSCLLAT